MSPTPEPTKMMSDQEESMPGKRFMGFRGVVWAWAFYDLANTIFSALFVSLTFTVLIDKHLGGTKEIAGWTVSASCALSAVIVPIFGTISDRVGRRIPLLFIMTVTCCVVTPIMAYLPLYPALAAAAIAMFAYYSGLALYDALLPDLATREEQGRVSGLGVGVGYGGTLLALPTIIPIQAYFGEGTLGSLKALSWTISILFFAFALPLFLVHRERPTGKKVALGSVIGHSFKRVIEGAKVAPKSIWVFIASSFFFVNSVMAVIVFFYPYANETMGWSIGEFVPIYAGLAAAAMVGGLVGGRLVDKIGPKNMLFIAGGAWIVILIFMTGIETKASFIGTGIAGGIALSWVWTAQRPLLCRLGDPDRMGETFGFLGFASRSSTILGPAVFGSLSTRVGYTAAFISLMVFFAIGMAILVFVPSGETPAEN